MLRRRVEAAVTLLFFFICISITGAAQTVTGTLSGTITDAAGAVVPNASVTAKNRETSVTRTGTTKKDRGYSSRRSKFHLAR